MTGLSEIKQALDEHLNRSVASKVNAIYQFNLKEGYQYHLIANDGQLTLEEGEHDAPSVTLATDQDTLLGIVNGEINGMQAFMMGKIKFSGDMGLAMKLKDLFSK